MLEYLRPILEHTLSIALDDAQYARLADYWTRVKNAPLNLTAVKDDESAALLHFADALSPLAFGLIEENAALIDVGTGGGFPAVPLAVARADLRVLALDATKKKLSFIEENAPCPNLKCLHARAEDAGKGALRETFDVSVARAVAPLCVVLEYLAPFVRVGGRVIAYKAALRDDERLAGDAAARLLGLVPRKFHAFTLQDRNESVARTLCVYEKTAPTPKKYPRSQARQKPLGEKRPAKDF